MYRVLYRKWRPTGFADVIGQSHVTSTLKNEIKSGRISHAYLFTGSRGTGKTTCAKILAKAVNCLNLTDGEPCGKCENCIGISKGSIMDVVEMDAASNNSVNNIREVLDEVMFTPSEAKFRVYIIDEVHMLSTGAFNALLKTLEEPPSHVVFILATTEVHKLPATILSRCQRFDFNRIAPEDIADRLQYIAAEENVTLDRNAAMLIAAVADGAMRDALSLLDQCMGRSEGHITEETVRLTAGLADKSHLIRITDSVRAHDSAAIIEMIDELYKNSKDMARLCEELIEHYRELMLIKTMKQPRNIIIMSESEFQNAHEQAMSIQLSDIVRAIGILQSAQEKMLRGANRRIEMEMTAVKLCSAEAAAVVGTDPAVEKRVAAIEKVLASLKNSPQRTEAKPAARQRTMLAPAKRPGADEMEKLRSNAVAFSRWPEVVEEISKYSPTVAAGFSGSKAYISGRYILVDSDKDICFECLRKAELRDKVRETVRQLTGEEYKLGRYSYPDEKKEDDPLDSFINDLKASGVNVEEN